MADHIGKFNSSAAGTAAVTASATGTGPGSNAVHGLTSSASDSAIYGEHTGSGIGVFGRGGPTGGEGVFGQTNSGSSGVYGKNTNATTGATGINVNPGVTGESAAGTGILGISNLAGVQLIDTFTPGGIGVAGVNDQPYGIGVVGRAENVNGIGISGSGNVGVFAHNSTLNPTGGTQNDVYLASQGFAGDFLGDVSVQGNVTVAGDVILTGADCAEEFDIAGVEEIEPGTVMVIDQDGALQQSQYAYDKRVAGVVSGAGNYRPGIILDKQQPQDNRIPIALVGKVYCRVDAQYALIEVGDLLTTSPTPGHAMKADDPLKAFGSVIGKALRPLKAGQGMIPILIALQ
jgi:hypothetical protein